MKLRLHGTEALSGFIWFIWRRALRNFRNFRRSFCHFARPALRGLPGKGWNSQRRNINFRHVTFVMLYFFAKQLPTHISQTNKQRSQQKRSGLSLYERRDGEERRVETAPERCSIDVHKWIPGAQKAGWCWDGEWGWMVDGRGALTLVESECASK